MRKGWRFVFWLGVVLLGAAVWVSWWAVGGFSLPICQQSDVSDRCLSYDEIRGWTAQSYDFALRLAARAK